MFRQIVVACYIFIGIIFFLGCSKEQPKEIISELKTNSFSSEDAKVWYTNNSKNPQANQTGGQFKGKINKLLPLWEKARSTTDATNEIVECPLKFDKSPGFAISKKGDNKSSTNGITRMLILKNKETGKMQTVLMHIYSNNGEIDEKITYTERGNKFSGTIFYTDVSGNFINGWLYQNGKIIKKSESKDAYTSPSLKTNSLAGQLAPNIASSDGCQVYETFWYERTCTETQYNYSCGPWEYIGSTYTQYCPFDGNGGGGGGGLIPEINRNTSLLKDITANLYDPCLLKTWGLLMSSGVAEGLNRMLKQTFGLSSEFNITLGEAQSMTDIYGNILAGSAFPSLNSSGGIDIDLKLSLSVLQNASQEYIAATIYHEIIHAYFDATGVVGYEQDQQHEAMATSYINEITNALQKSFPNSTTDLSKLAWMGLTRTNVYKWGTLSPIEQGNIRRVLQDNQVGNAGEICN